MNREKKIILLIEDNADFLEATAEILQMSDFIVYTAKSGQDGIQQARTTKPDLIICDIMMPDLNGYQVLSILNRSPNTADIPFIFLTAMAQRKDLRKGMELGADDYLTKPYDEEELLNAIEARLQKRDRIQRSNLNSLETLIDESRAANLVIDMAEGSRIRKFRKKQKIYLAGEQQHNVFLVKEGKIRTYQRYMDEREMVTGIFSSGDFFGYESALLNQKHTDSAEALDDSELYLVPRTEFNSLLFKDVRIAKRFIELLSGNVVAKQEQILNLAYDTVRKRVAAALVQLHSKFCQKDELGCEIRITREGMAAMVGTAIETVSRTLSDFKEEGLIEKEGSKIKIISIELLKQM